MKPAWLMTWAQMNDLETLTYDMKALLEVVSDGLLNQECPSNPEDSAGVIRQAVDKLEKVKGIHEEMWDAQRKSMPKAGANVGTDEDDDGEEDFDTEDLFSDNEDEDEDEDEDEAQERHRKSSGSFTVEEIGTNEDGSATFMVDASEEDMKKLFEVFFTQALINGIKYTAADNDKETAKIQALKVARQLVFTLNMWEGTDSFDYEPNVRHVREKLEKALEEAGL